MYSLKYETRSISTHETLFKSQKARNDNDLSQSELNSNNEYSLRIRIIGPKESGKTSFVIRINQNKFDSFYIPSISQERTIVRYMLNANIQRLCFIVEDIENFEINSLAHGELLFIFFDESTPNSFNDVKLFLERSNVLNDPSRNKDVFIIGNKNDIKSNHLDYDTIENYCKSNEISLTEISVKTNVGIPKLMQLLEKYFTHGEWCKTFVYSPSHSLKLF